MTCCNVMWQSWMSCDERLDYGITIDDFKISYCEFGLTSW